jgi:transposase-like protein
MSRRRYTDKQRQGWVAKFERSTSSAAAFCSKHQLNYQSFLRWRREAGGGAESGPEFLELEVPCPAGTGEAEPEMVELTFPSGLVLRIQPQRAPGS